MISNGHGFAKGCCVNEAVANKDTTAQAQAQAVLDDIPTWPALNASDGGGVIDAWRRNAEFTAAGDVPGVLDNLYTNNCTVRGPGRIGESAPRL